MLELLASLMLIVPTNVAASPEAKKSDLGSAPVGSAAKPIDLIFSGLRSSNGKVAIAIFDESEASSFPKGERALKHFAVDAKAVDGKLTVTVPDLPPGKYAFAVFHDEDSSGDFKFGFMGIPREGIAFSNNPRIYFGPPSFDKASVNTGTTGTLMLEMKYF